MCGNAPSLFLVLAHYYTNYITFSAASGSCVYHEVDPICWLTCRQFSLVLVVFSCFSGVLCLTLLWTRSYEDTWFVVYVLTVYVSFSASINLVCNFFLVLRSIDQSLSCFHTYQSRHILSLHTACFTIPIICPISLHRCPYPHWGLKPQDNVSHPSHS